MEKTFGINCEISVKVSDGVEIIPREKIEEKKKEEQKQEKKG